nr:hypothetical protein [Tanacetum cinerariifolium]
LEISSLKARIKLLEDKDKRIAELSGDDALIKGRSLETEEEAGVEKSIERGSNDTKEMVNVLTSMDAANILTSRVQAVSVPPVVEVSTVGVPTSSGPVPTVSDIFTTASVVTPYSRRKEKSEHNVDFHQIVDFVEASHIRPKSTSFNEFSSNIATAVIAHTHTYYVPFHTRNLFTTLRVNSPSFSGRTVPLFATMLVTQGEGSGTPTELHHTPSSEASQSPHHDTSSPFHSTVTTERIPSTIPTEIPTLRQYSRRATWIGQSKALPTAVDEPASLFRDDSQGEAFLVVSCLEAGHDRENIIKTSALPYDSTPRVTSLDTDEGSM